jgi:hypothetical protein
MKPERWILGALVVAAFGAIRTADVSADRISTTSGQTFTGKILEETAESVVIQTMSGKVAVPRATINTIEKEGSPEAAKIVPAVVDPAKAAEAFEESKSAMAADDWVRAGNLLEGLLKLDMGSFPQENRLTASAALVTCYLQIKDAKGAAAALRLRANLVALETDKKRLIAPAEALEASGTPAIGDVAVGRYEEAIEVGTEWKARQILALAKQLGANATGLDAMDRVERSARAALGKLDEADLYVPGFSQAQRAEVLSTLADNIMDAVQRAVEICTEDRKDLSRYWQTSAYGIKTAMEWNERASRYLAIRQAAEDGLKNLQPFADKFEVPELYKEREMKVQDLLAKLDDLKYHVKREGMKERYQIALRKIGGN